MASKSNGAVSKTTITQQQQQALKATEINQGGDAMTLKELEDLQDKVQRDLI